MTAARRTVPAWVDTSQPHSDKPRTQLCPRCQQPVLRALVGHVAALDVRADPQPLDAREELAARLQGRMTYCLRLHPHLPARLLNRGTEHIRAGRCTHLVIADHHCTRTTATEPPRTAPTTDRLF